MSTSLGASLATYLLASLVQLFNGFSSESGKTATGACSSITPTVAEEALRPGFVTRGGTKQRTSFSAPFLPV